MHNVGNDPLRCPLVLIVQRRRIYEIQSEPLVAARPVQIDVHVDRGRAYMRSMAAAPLNEFGDGYDVVGWHVGRYVAGVEQEAEERRFA